MPGRPPNPQRDKIRAMYADGHRQVDIARDLNITIKSVRWHTRDMKKPTDPNDRYIKTENWYRYGVPRGRIDQLSQQSLEWILSNSKPNDTIFTIIDRIVRTHHAKV